MIDDHISQTANDMISASARGAEMANTGSRAQATQLLAQAVPDTAGAAFSVDIEAAVIAPSGDTLFTKLAALDQTTPARNIPISWGVAYRFRHRSGEPATVRMGG